MIRFMTIVVAIFLSGCVAHMAGSGPEISEETCLEVISLQHAVAGELCETLRSLIGDSPTPAIAVDGRTNSILIQGTPCDVQRVQHIVTHLDRKVVPASE